jgi:hypothetical protein
MPPEQKFLPHIVQKTCDMLGCTPEMVEKSRHNSISTTYQLLLEAEVLAMKNAKSESSDAM